MDEFNLIKKWYLSGKEIKHWARTIYWQSEQMLKNSYLVENLGNAQRLASALESKALKAEPEEQMRVFQVLMSYYKGLIDDVAIISAFEIYAKARLLNGNYIIHEVTGPENYKKLQKSKPLHFRTYRAAMKSEEIALSKKTLSASILLGKNYAERIGLKTETINVLKSMNDSRNQIHFHLARKSTLNSRIIDAILDLKDAIEKCLTRYS